MTIIDSRHGIHPRGYEVPKDDLSGRELGGAVVVDGAYDLCPESLRLMGLELEWECSGVEPGPELDQMRRLVNEWEWNEGHGQGGQHRWRDSQLLVLYRPVTDQDLVARMGGSMVPRVSDQVIVVVTSARGAHYVVKCDRELVQPQDMIHRGRLARWAPTRSMLAVAWPDGRSKDHNWLEPVEYLRAGSGVADHDGALDLAKSWAGQIQAEWADDLATSATGVEIVFSPDRMPTATPGGDEEYERVLDDLVAVLDRYRDPVVEGEESLPDPWEGVDAMR